MNRFVAFGTLLVLAAATGRGAAPSLVAPDQFVPLDTLKGDGWSLTRCAIEGDYEWGADFRVREKTLYRFGLGASKDDVRYCAWPSAKDPRLLCVYRRGRGQGGPYALDVIDLKDGYKRVLSSEGGCFQFRDGMKDLDGDGWPEFVGVSDAFCSARELPWDLPGSEEPYPIVVMTYDRLAHRYRSGAYLFPEFTAAACSKWESEFTKRLDGGKVSHPLPATLLQDRNAPGPQAELLWWVLELIYSGHEKDAWEALDTHCERALARAMRESIEQVLRRDDTYTDMIQFRKEKLKP